MTSQEKWHEHALDVIKTANQTQQIKKYQEHKYGNRHHDSIPLVPNDFKGKLKLRLPQYFRAVSFSM